MTYSLKIIAMALFNGGENAGKPCNISGALAHIRAHLHPFAHDMTMAELWPELAQCFMHVLGGTDAQRKAAEHHLDQLACRDGV